MSRFALIALLVATSGPALASEPLAVTVSDRTVPAFLQDLLDESTADSDTLRTSELSDQTVVTRSGQGTMALIDAGSRQK